STCPSPERYMKAYDCEAEHVYAVTLSSPLSGSYNSAELGKSLYLEEHQEKLIHIFDSRTASVGETLIAMKIQECEEAGASFEEVIQKVDDYISKMNTFFVLETLETLRKNGRLSNIKAFVASALNIKPVMGSTPEGTICQLSQARGMARALDKMIATMLEKTKDQEEKILAISHCNCPKRASDIMEKVKSQGKFKEVFMMDTGGISSMYASDGGIIIVV
ncbi:MAG: DegV family protein, partial [Lachnospiraceae bacterium]